MKVRIKNYKKGTYIYLEQNNSLDDFYILKKGEILITRFNPLKGNVEDRRNDGYIFGIKQCITQIPENERVQALVDCEVIIVNKNQIEQLYTDSPKVILKILSEYSEILRNLDNSLLERDPVRNFMSRAEIIIDLAEQYIKNEEPKIASHLLQSYLNEPEVDSIYSDKIKNKLKTLPNPEVSKPNGVFENKTFLPNQVIFVEMEQGDSLYMIRSGKVKITNIRKGKEILIAVLEEGSIFGEMAILNNKPRNATAVANTVCDVSIINKKGINNLPPSLFSKILEHLTHRIWITEKIIFCMDIHNPVARAYYILSSKIKQEISHKESYDSNFTYVFKSTINELYELANIKDEDKENMFEFEKDENIAFYQNSIKIRSLKTLFDKNSYYLNRLTLKKKL